MTRDKNEPFFKTAHVMVKNLSYIILNMLALLTTGQIIFDPTHYNSNWKSKSVVIFSFINTSSDRIRILLASKVIIIRFSVYGDRSGVDKAIRANAISFTIAFSKEVSHLAKSGWSEVGKLSNGKFSY